MGTWFSDGTRLDALDVWANPTSYLPLPDAQALTGLTSPTDAEIRAAIRELDVAAGVTRLVGAFHATDTPITSGADPNVTASLLAAFVDSHELDGAVISFEETIAFSLPGGAAETWLATLTTQLRATLPSAIIAHAPQASYFAGAPLFPGGGYQAVHSGVGDLIDWYAVQFYNQGSSTYDTEQTLVFMSNGFAANTALEQIVAGGVPASQLFVGKIATVLDGSGGYVAPPTLLTILTDNPSSWGGIAAWQFSSDEAAGFAFGNTLCPAAPAPPMPEPPSVPATPSGPIALASALLAAGSWILRRVRTAP